MTAVDWRASVMLYRSAVAQRSRARARATAHAETGDNERRLREIDAVIATVVLAQAALESAINEGHLATGVVPKDGWVKRWELGCNEIARRRGRPDGSAMPSGLLAELRSMSAWRQFLVHSDDKARSRLQSDAKVDPNVAYESLTAELADWVIETADAVLTWGSGVSGIAWPSSDYLWIAHDEL